MRRIAPGLAVVLTTLLCATPAVEAKPCKAPKACKAKPAKKKPGTGWIGGTYNGGPGDPILAPIKG